MRSKRSKQPAYIEIDEEGYLTLCLGNGTEPYKTVLLDGPYASQGQQLVEDIETMKAWAEDNGYHVVVPHYDLSAPEPAIDVDGIEDLDLAMDDDALDLLNDLYQAGDYDAWQ